ncbi:MAG: ferric reductase-like transmembrane domain-containing protein [bacterium]
MKKILIFGLLSLFATLYIQSPIAYASSTSQTPDISVSPIQGPSVSKKLENRAVSSWPWYITRASGIVAVALLLCLILSGIGLVTGYTFKLFEPLTAWAVHKALGLTMIVCVAIHGLALLFDTYVPFTLAQILFPFASNYTPAVLFGMKVGTIWVALGIFAFYGLVAIIISSLLIIDKKPRIWKYIHILSYLVAIMIYFHGLYLGTDLTHGIFRTTWIMFGIVAFLAAIFRIARSRSI